MLSGGGLQNCPSKKGYDEVLRSREREAPAGPLGMSVHKHDSLSKQQCLFSGPSKMYSMSSCDSYSSETIPSSTLERLQSLERMQSLTGPGEGLMRCALKMPAKEAEVLGTATSLQIPRTSSAGDRVQVPKGNKEYMQKLVDALEVANDMFKAGTISESAYTEMCTGIQDKMDELVCLWVVPR